MSNTSFSEAGYTVLILDINTFITPLMLLYNARDYMMCFAA